MSYFRISNKDDSLPIYVWGDNGPQALRKAEQAYGAMPPQRTAIESVAPENVPTWVDVIDEPIQEKESRLDGLETETEV